METETIFRMILPVLIIAFAAHRGYYVRKHGEEQNTLKKREEGLASKIAGILGMIGFVAILVYAIDPAWLSWASLPLPLWLRWTRRWHCTVWVCPAAMGAKLRLGKTGAIPRA